MLVPCRLASLLVLSVLFASVPAQAQQYPAKAIRWVVPYPAGGGSDFLARTIAQQLSTQIGHIVAIDNKSGANTSIAASDVARSQPDGYTILSADDGTMVFNSALYAKLPYDPEKDLRPVTLMGKFPMILIVGKGSEAKDAKDFIAKAKARPGSVSYGSAGAGSPHHLAMELLKVNASLHMVHIPYRGAAPSLTDVASGQVSAMMVDMAAGAAFISSGKVRPLAVANPTRLPQLPDVPTFAELGYKDVVAAAQVGVVVPVGTPAEVVGALQKQIVGAINQPSVHQKLMEFGIEPVAGTPKQYEELLRSERARWHKLIAAQHIRLD
jgi:tripartite-type tricarboxylate transporter receptor subunit TctC